MFICERAIPSLVEEDNELLLDTEAKEKERVSVRGRRVDAEKQIEQ